MSKHLLIIMLFGLPALAQAGAPPPWSEARAEELSGEARLEYALGHVEAQRYEEARRWFESSAAAGESRAKLNLGWLHEEGLLGEVDGPAAIAWYTRGVEAGESEYAIKLAWVHLQGRLAPPSLATAEHWFEYAIDHGHAQAKLGLGSVLMAEVMGGDAGRSAQTIELFEGALDEGYPLASYYLGRIYREGIGVPTDDARALRYYAVGAATGIADAQWRLAEMYAEGAGTDQDLIEAGKWAYLAAANGAEQGRDLLRALEPQLDEDERREARSRAWQAASGGDVPD